MPIKKMFDILKNLKIRAKLFSLVIVSLAGFVVFDYLGYHTLDFLKVNGPLYSRIIQGKDIIADVLPPPQYIIESYLIAHHMLVEKHPEGMEKLFQGSARLEKEYIERRNFWLENLPEGELKEELATLSHRPAMEFFKLRNEMFFPLIINGEIGKAADFLDQSLEPLYQEHRKHIERVVEIAKRMNEADEQYAKRIVFERSALLIGWGIVVVAAGAFLSLYFVDRITIPLSRITRAAKKISEGDMSGQAIVIDSKDEIGVLSKAIEEMRIALQRTLSGLEQKVVELKQAREELIVSRAQSDERTALLESAHRQMQEVNAMNELLLETIPFGMDIIDEDANILAISPKLEAIFGAQIIGRKCWSVYRDNKAQCSDCPLGKDVGMGKAVTIESEGLFGARTFQITHSGLMYQGKKAILEIFQDITERKRQEQELKAAHEQLKEAQGKLVQSAKMASVGQLAAGVAHGINNPLTGALNNVQLIKMLIKKNDGIALTEFINTLDVIEESVLRCASITRSLLDFSSPGQMGFGSLSLNDMIERAISLVDRELKFQSIAIERQLQEDLPHISGEPQLLQQAVFDILMNARWAIGRHSGSQGGRIAVKTWYNLEKKKVCFSISDTGIGIPEDNLGKIFDPFFTTKPVGEGAGLGLSIVYSIIKKHNGDIEVDSKPGEGAAFIVSLPVFDNSAVVAAEQEKNGNQGFHT